MFDSVPPNLPTTDGPAPKAPAAPPMPSATPAIPSTPAPMSMPSKSVQPASQAPVIQEEHVTVMPSKFFVPPKARLPWKKIGLAVAVTLLIAAAIIGVTWIVQSRIRPEQTPPTAPPSGAGVSNTPSTSSSPSPEKTGSTQTPPPSVPPVTPAPAPASDIPAVSPPGTTPPGGTTPPLSTNPPATEPAGDRPLSSASDRDTDGLSDEEEIVIGADPSLADTDKDGFSDGKELANLFSPNSVEASKKLWETTVVNKYHHPTLGYELLYPAAWVARSASADGQTIVFSASTATTVTVTATANPDRLATSSWYVKQNPTTASSGTTSVVSTRSGLSGVMSPTGLVAVFSVESSGGPMIIQFQYRTTDSSAATYKALYQMMISSFQMPLVKAFWPF